MITDVDELRAVYIRRGILTVLSISAKPSDVGTIHGSERNFHARP